MPRSASVEGSGTAVIATNVCTPLDGCKSPRKPSRNSPQVAVDIHAAMEHAEDFDVRLINDEICNPIMPV
jgi:hypothetical protein